MACQICFALIYSCFVLILIILHFSVDNALGNSDENKLFVQSDVIKVNIDYAKPCQNAVQCFAEHLVQCTAEQEVMQIKLKLTPILQLSTFFSQHPLFSIKNSIIDSVLLNLKLDTGETNYDIKQTKTLQNQLFSESITKEVMYYQNKHANWKRKFINSQFKSIYEVHSTVSSESKNGSFFRGILQFVQCGKVQLFGFIRYQQTLYQLKPQFWKNETQVVKNVHQLFTVASDLDPSDSFFTIDSYSKEKSVEDEMRKRKKRGKEKKDASEHNFCFISAIADLEFYKRLNSSPAHVVIYIKLAYMLANEIFTNSKWDNKEFRNYKVGLPVVDIDLTIASDLGHLSEKEVLDMLIAKVKQTDYCLLHLFSGQWIKRESDDVIHGIAIQNGFFTEKNVGATSIFGCGHDPWKVQCLQTFSHELAHSMGSPHDKNRDEKNKTISKTRGNNTFLMSETNKIETPISAQNLKLSPDSIQIIENFLNEKSESFLNAKNWADCGNGILEAGEQCDEGLASLCCNRQCRFLTNSSCSPFNSLCCTMQCSFKTYKNKNNANNLSLNELEFATACVPWNYCPDLALFCTHQKHFCPLEEIEVDCDAILTKTSIASSPTSYFSNIRSSTKTISSPITETFTTSTYIIPTTTNAPEKATGYTIYWIMGCVVVLILIAIVIVGIKYRPKHFCKKNNTNLQTNSLPFINPSNTGEDSPDVPLNQVNINNNNNNDDDNNNTNNIFDETSFINDSEPSQRVQSLEHTSTNENLEQDRKKYNKYKKTEVELKQIINELEESLQRL